MVSTRLLKFNIGYNVFFFNMFKNLFLRRGNPENFKVTLAIYRRPFLSNHIRISEEIPYLYRLIMHSEFEMNNGNIPTQTVNLLTHNLFNIKSN